mmetsp:Transcript_115694/g.172900  ORF Transcript_115694/g.172900 Transcript_115694/m.172900 type:complete len:83 (+) Transcript_115694:338-586(+)
MGMCCPMTYLECVANDMSYLSDYLIQAANLEDPLERMKLVVASMCAHLHRNPSIVKNKAPLDCFLGETLQGKKENGTEIFCE